MEYASSVAGGIAIALYMAEVLMKAISIRKTVTTAGFAAAAFFGFVLTASTDASAQYPQYPQQERRDDRRNDGRYDDRYDDRQDRRDDR